MSGSDATSTGDRVAKVCVSIVTTILCIYCKTHVVCSVPLVFPWWISCDPTSDVPRPSPVPRAGVQTQACAGHKQNYIYIILNLLRTVLRVCSKH